MKQTTFKGKTITDSDMLQAMERFDREYRASFPARKWVTYAVEHDGKLYPPKETMRVATGFRDVGKGGKDFNTHFEELGFNVITIKEHETTEAEEEFEEEAIETSISLERDLEDFLEANLAQLEPDLKLYKAEGISGRQVDTKVVGIIDLLAVNKSGDLVVIELKAGEANDRVCGQIQRYMGWVKERLAKSNEVRGILVASDFSEGLIYAAKSMPAVTLKKYAVSFRFSNAGG